MITREELLSKKQPPFVTEDVPEWGGVVGIPTLTASQVWELTDECGVQSAELATPDDYARSAAMVVARSLLTEDGSARLFSDEDAAWLMAQGGTVLRLSQLIQQHNGMTKRARETIRKNLPSGPTSDSIPN